jgi:hypothetical protein
VLSREMKRLLGLQLSVCLQSDPNEKIH